MTPEQSKCLDELWRFRKVPTLGLADWADAHRRLSAMSSAISGNWLTSRFEIARGPMTAVREEGVSTITCMVATQLLKTELLLNIIGYQIANDPCPILLVLPKDDACKSFSKERFTPMVRATPALRDIFGTVYRDRSGESLSYKEFPGGFLAIEFGRLANQSCHARGQDHAGRRNR